LLPRDDFERKPYDLILFSLGSEIESEQGTLYLRRRVEFRSEWPTDRQLQAYHREGELRSVRFVGIIDDIRPDATAGELRYTLNGQSQSLEVEVNNDWADGLTVAILMGEIADAIGDGRRFWGADNGQANILFFLADDRREAANNKLKPIPPNGIAHIQLTVRDVVNSSPKARG
jgi:hypothetical protein